MRFFASNRRTALVVGCIVSCAFAQLTAAWAQPTVAPAKSGAAREPLEIKLVRSKVTVAGGKESLTSATTAKPGEILQEVATYSNTSNAALSQLEATLPVPVNTELVMSSAQPANALASTDGRKFSAMPLKQRVRQPNGVESEQLIELNQYRFLRWQVGSLPAGRSMVFSARFKVLDDVSGVTSGGSKQ